MRRAVRAASARAALLAGMAACMTLGALAPAVYAQSYRDVAPVPPPRDNRPAAPPAPVQPSGKPAQIAVASLRALAFVPAAEANAQAPSATAQAAVTADHLPLLDAAFLHSFDADLGRPLTFARLAQIRRAVIQRYRTAGEPLVDVYLPEQDVTDGRVRIAVAIYHLGQVRVSGNRYFSSALLVGEMPLAAGAPIRENDVASGLVLLNDNPYRQVEVVYAPGATPNTTDVILQAEDRLPLRVNAAYDNAGVPQLGRERYSAGIDYGNLFGLDQQIAYQFTASNDIFGNHPSTDGGTGKPRFVADSINYVAPLPWHDRLELFGVFAQSTPSLPNSLAQTGVSAQVSARYDWLLPMAAGWRQQTQFGYDFKRSNNNLEFGGFQVFNSNTHIHQFLVAYDATRPDALGQNHANLMLVMSPGGLDGDNNDSAFNAARFGAKSRYVYSQLSGQRDVTLGAGVSLTLRGLFQWTPDTLLPSEELGLGGDSSVRGYDPYVVLGDRGWNLQTELRSPSFPFGASSAAVQPFIFVDAGHVWTSIDQPAEVGNSSLLSTGAGLRFQVGRYVSAQGTLGKPMRSAVPNGSKAPLVEFSVTLGS